MVEILIKIYHYVKLNVKLQNTCEKRQLLNSLDKLKIEYNELNNKIDSLVVERTHQIKQEIYTIKWEKEDINFKLKNFKEANERLTNEIETLKLKYKKLKDSSDFHEKKQLTLEENEYIFKLVEDNKKVNYNYYCKAYFRIK